MPKSPSPEFRLPPRPLQADGRPRRVGVEIEFIGPSARLAATALAAGLGGRLAEEDPHAFRLEGTALGDIRVELDLRAAHPQRRAQVPGVVPGLPVRAAGRSLAALLSPVVPREVITGPLPLAQLPEVDRLAALLQGAGGRGRGAVLLGSLGLHFNVEPPDCEAATLTGLLQAYLRSEPALRKATAAGGFLAARGLPPPFPAAYVAQVLDPGYRPDLDGLARDYLAANPTRHRGLDLLPILAHRDEAGVRAALPPDEKVSPRPVLHYRLPQAHIGLAGWSLAPAWNLWVGVEELAEEMGALAGR
ncbi:amidoligase family protein [Methylobacterium nonmethylotrophicum]|uniref:amidoligase family protein n=1 Tax=Methylobacterium nonmethylotrophicum TaxID=1141884 RepID=UPI001FE065F5|nr:amidoligase family protein [Methylobacterium nonmethylotrophicum]